MNRHLRAFSLSILTLACVAVWRVPLAAQFETPLYINIGGPQVTDSRNRVWRGDQGAAADPLGIRVDDAGGGNTIEAWCTPAPDSLQALGFDPANPNDAVPLSSIRWDLGNDGIDYAFAIPVAPGMYDLDLYFCESCCPFRHFQVNVQGETVFENVSSSLYAGAVQRAGRLSVTDLVVGDDGILAISLLPCPACDCPECTGGVVIDNNAILSAIAVEPAGFDPCRDPLVGRCPSALTCTIDGDGLVTGTWTAPECDPPASYEVRKNGVVLASGLDPTATMFNDTLTERAAVYEVIAQFEGEDVSCLPLACTVVNPNEAFTAPFHINLGGRGVVDSIGRAWLGDQGAGLDPLGIRPNDVGGTNTIETWCNPSPVSLQASGLDPFSASDAVPLQSIRWDPGADAIPYILELPVAPGDYDVEIYLCEQCCPNRHYSIAIQGTTVFPDVSVNLYAGGAVHTAGRLRADGITVADGEPLNVTVTGCLDPTCPGGGDANAILSALCVLPASSEPCDNPLFGRCPTNLQCSLAGNTVTGTFAAPVCEAPEMYELYRDGALLAMLPGDATSFTDTLTVRVANYELRAPGNCLAVRCRAINPAAPFAQPLYVNLGGPESTDSLGRTWFADQGPGVDSLGIRPNDAGGFNTIEAWCTPTPDSLAALGFDPSVPTDGVPLRSIRWDDGGDTIDYVLQIPLAEEGLYDVELYFCESCCPQRHFKIEIQEATAFPDVSSGLYAGGLSNVAGRLVAEDVAVVADGLLNVTLLPCRDPECPGGLDGNAIFNALCVTRVGDLSGDTVNQLAGDCDQNGAQDIADIICSLKLTFGGFFLLDATRAEPPCARSAGDLAILDINGDGRRDVSDIVGFAMYLFLGGAPPVQGAGCFPLAVEYGCPPVPGCP